MNIHLDLMEFTLVRTQNSRRIRARFVHMNFFLQTLHEFVQIHANFVRLCIVFFMFLALIAFMSMSQFLS